MTASREGLRAKASVANSDTHDHSTIGTSANHLMGTVLRYYSIYSGWFRRMLPAPSGMRRGRGSTDAHVRRMSRTCAAIPYYRTAPDGRQLNRLRPLGAFWAFRHSRLLEASARNLLNRRCRDGSITRSILQSFLADGIGILTNSDFASAMQNEEHLFVYTMIVKGKRTFAGWHGGDVARHTIDLKPALRSVSRQGPAAGQCWANASRFRSASQGGRIPISWRMKLPVPCNRFGRIDRIPGRSDRKWRP